MATQPLLMSVPFANAGAKNPIPQNTTSLGKASLTNGFPTETSMPIDDGGVPPQRADFNGMLYWLSTFAMFQQSGGKFTYSAELFYDPPSIIFYNNDLWWCKQKNGPNAEYGGVHTPGNVADNEAYWIKLRDYLSNPLSAYPIGAYYISSKYDDETDHPSYLFGGTWEQVQDRMILAAGKKYSAGGLINPRIGGSDTKKLTTPNIPSHTHTFTTSTAGNHTHNVTGSTQTAGSHTHQVEGSTQGAGEHSHTRGSMEITGNFNASQLYDSGSGISAAYAHGAFEVGGSASRLTVGSTGDFSQTGFNFAASRSWSGTTSKVSNHTHDILKTKVTALQNGSHVHTVNITVGQAGSHNHTGTTGGTGNGTSFDIMPPYIVAYVWRRIA